MARTTGKRGRVSKPRSTTKYDAHNQVLDATYGSFADLRRELADSKATVAERAELLESFSLCTDYQRAWLLLEDYLEKLSLSRKDFPAGEWWNRLLDSAGRPRLEQTAHLFLRAKRPLPSELIPYADTDRFAEIEEKEQQEQLVELLESWLLPRAANHLDAPRASILVACQPAPLQKNGSAHGLKVELILTRPRSGRRRKRIQDILDLTTRAAHERELFSTEDWDFIEWLSQLYGEAEETQRTRDQLWLEGLELVQWLTRWGHLPRLIETESVQPLNFRGQPAQLQPHLENHEIELSFTHRLETPDGTRHRLEKARFFRGQPSLVLVGHTFYLLRNAPPSELFEAWFESPIVPVRRLTHRLLTHLRRAGENGRHGVAEDDRNLWQELCETHPAKPQFVFELEDATVRLQLQAVSEKDQSVWEWNGHEWQRQEEPVLGQKPQILDDPRLEPAEQWLRRLDWFTPEPGLWLGDATEAFLNHLADAWPLRPEEAKYLGNAAFQRLFLSSRPLKPKIVLNGSGIDWLSVSAEWEQEGMRLSPADLERLQTATGRFVKLPDSGWVELDAQAVRQAHETFSDLGLEGLNPLPEKVDLLHASQASTNTLDAFGNAAKVDALRERLKDFQGVPKTGMPAGIDASLRPYQLEGFHFLCHLTRVKMGGVLADDMGLGKTLQTLTWLAWLRNYMSTGRRKARPALVICPASVLHNWRREANRFVPDLKVLVLESGAERHNLRGQIPEHDLIITNYALLRRDLKELKKFEFGALILDEAQFIKNPGAQVTQSVKQLKARHRLALTGTPLENRILDLWSIVDFAQPGYLGDQSEFLEKYEARGDTPDWMLRSARKRLSAKLRPLLLRRLKKQVARDLPERFEERRDCELPENQRQLYLAELRRSRDKVLQTVAEQGLAKSRIHVLAALTRLRQICCHPRLVGNDSTSGKTDTLFEMVEPLLADGQKVLVFSQFVQMLKIIEHECLQRNMRTHLLSGETKNRHEVVQQFQEDTEPSLFLLSLRAAGTGLNLTNASYVVLYDPWWNPAVEAQAIDRSHRIGQQNNVFAYRLIAPGTVEEKIWDLQQRKSQTISDVLGEEGFARNLSKSDLEYLFSED